MEANKLKEVNKNVSDLKMYFLVKDTVPLGWAINSVAHAAVAAHDEWSGSNHLDKLWRESDPVYMDWFTHSFKKVTCKVEPGKFEAAKRYGEEHKDWIVIEENSPPLNGEETVIVFKPRYEWDKFFSWLQLYK